MLGPMVYGCAFCPLSMKDSLSDRWDNSLAGLHPCASAVRRTAIKMVVTDKLAAVSCISAHQKIR